MPITVNYVGEALHPGLYSVPQERGDNAINLFDGGKWMNCTARNVRKDVLKAGVPASDPVEFARVDGLIGYDSGRAGISVVSGIGNWISNWEQDNVARSFFNSEPWHLPDPLGTPCLDTLIENVQLGDTNFWMAVSKGSARGRVSATIRNLRQKPGTMCGGGTWFAAIPPPEGELPYKSLFLENVHTRTDFRGFWPRPGLNDDLTELNRAYADAKYDYATYGQNRWTTDGADPWQTITDFYEGPLYDVARGGLNIASDPSKVGFFCWTQLVAHNWWNNGRPVTLDNLHWIGYEPILTHDAGWTPNDIEPPVGDLPFTVIMPEKFNGSTPPPPPPPPPDPEPEPVPDLSEIDWLKIELFLNAIKLAQTEEELAGTKALLSTAHNTIGELSQLIDGVHDALHPYDLP